MEGGEEEEEEKKKKEDKKVEEKGKENKLFYPTLLVPTNCLLGVDYILLFSLIFSI